MRILLALLLLCIPALGAEYDIDNNNITLEFITANTDVWNLNGDNCSALNSSRVGATVNQIGAGSKAVELWYSPGTQPFNGQFVDSFAGPLGTTLAQHYPPWYGIRYPSTASNCVLNGSGAVSCDHSTALYSNATDYRFKTEVKYSVDMTIAAGTKAGIYFKSGDTSSGSLDLVQVYVDLATNKCELVKYVANTATTPLSAAVTYVAGATLSVMSADGIKWVVVYNGSQVGTEQTINEASLDSSVAGFMATSAGTTFDNWKAGRWQLGPELVTNGDGESLTGWTTTNGDLSSVVAGGAIGNCFKVSETNYGTSVIDSVVTFEAGKYYAFSVRVKRGSAGLFWALVHRLTSLGNIYLNPSGLAIATSTDAPPTDWVKYARVAGFPAGTADVIGIIRAEDSGGSGATEYTYFDEISIREIQ